MRLDKLLEMSAVGSRNQVKKIIKAHGVVVDGNIAKSGSQNVDPGLQTILVNDKQIHFFPATYLLVNKPQGVVSARSDAKHKTVIDLIGEEDFVEGLYPIGRLDRDTEGLVLVTNNGPLGFRMLHPKHHVTKEYFIKVNGLLGDDAVAFFDKGVAFLDGTRCQPSKLRIIQQGEEESSAYLTISEGKFHQVKKMFLSYGLKVTYLKRTAFDALKLNDLKVGCYRQLTDTEKEVIKQFLQ
ncbi:rRNA pseudouridine synthase [Streptococcus iniae]|nr:rRNA pseudouridine synthase [Streptococcus iniae]